MQWFSHFREFFIREKVSLDDSWKFGPWNFWLGAKYNNNGHLYIIIKDTIRFFKTYFLSCLSPISHVVRENVHEGIFPRAHDGGVELKHLQDASMATITCKVKGGIVILQKDEKQVNSALATMQCLDHDYVSSTTHFMGVYTLHTNSHEYTMNVLVCLHAS